MYQVVGKPRTGSALIYSYVDQITKENGGIPLHEFFLERYVWNGNRWYRDESRRKRPENKYNVLLKLEYLHNNDNVSYKVFPYPIIKMGYGNLLYNLLKPHRILTIDRDPFDAFLSFQHQELINWKWHHRLASKGQEVPGLVDVDISLKIIKSFVNRWVIETAFASSLPNIHTFNYDEDILNIDKLNSFFHVDKKPTDTVPMGIDYRKQFSNINQAEDIFYKELNKLI